jgi:serine protein kinase
LSNRCRSTFYGVIYPRLKGDESMSNIDISKLIKKDREERKGQKFEGTFLDYLEIVKKDPDVAMLAHQRMYERIVKPGVDVIKTEEHPRLRRIYGSDVLKRYQFFTDDFYGIDKTIMKIVRYFHSAAMAGEEARQVLYLVGPVGAGKSSLMEAIKKSLESSEPVYALEGCPIREEPLHLVPKHLRNEFEKILNVRIEGDLCPICRYRLKNEFNGEYEKFPVNTVDFSIRSRKGVGVVPPVDPNNQDTSVLIGQVDISKLDIYSEDDPRVMSLNGAFNVGNRGIVEFIEVFKNETEYLHTMITATQEKSVPSPGKGSMIYFDGIILAHSNEAEWNKFKADHTNEAILDRIVKIEIPYCLELNEEIKIYEKILKKSKFDAHIAPHTIEMASMFGILTRLSPSNKVDYLTKLKIYNGEEIVEKGMTRKIDIMELKDEATTSREGMAGISTRFIMKALDVTLSDSEHNCINPISVMETLVKATKELAIAEDEKEKYLRFIQDTMKKQYNKILEKEITKAFIHGYKEQVESLFNNYLDHAEAYVNKTKLKDKNTGEELEPDERFLRSIEEQIGITDTAAKGFRSDVTAYMFYVLRSGGKLDYGSYEPLKEAIEKKLTASVRELSRVVTLSKVRDKEQNEKYNAMVEEMKRNGYCDHCCNVVLKYAANNLWKD